MFTTLHTDLRIQPPRLWVVINQPLCWDDGVHKIEVPVGFVTDLASVPRIFRGVLDVTGRSRRAAVLHDWLYTEQNLSRAECDAIFRKALMQEGVGGVRWGYWISDKVGDCVRRAGLHLGCGIYWAGVRVGGWVAWGNKAQ